MQLDLLICVCLISYSAAFVPAHISAHRAVVSTVAHAESQSSSPGYRDEKTVPYKASEGTSWDFRYSSPDDRRAVSEAKNKEYTGPPLNILLLGKPCSGKGTLAPMISRAYRPVHVSSGNLLRAEARSGTDLGRIAVEQMSKNALVPTELVMSLVNRRLRQRDCQRNGWILDGFPRNKEQANLLQREGVPMDCLVVLERPDELVRQFSLGRMTDSATGVVYHPQFHPPPENVRHRLVWQLGDTEEAVQHRLQRSRETLEEVLACYPGLPVARINSARNEIETFKDLCTFLDGVAEQKAKTQGADAVISLEEQVDARLSDVALLDDEEAAEGGDGTLLTAVRRCNKYDMRQYMAVNVQGQQVGFASRQFADELRPYQEGGAVEFVAGDPNSPEGEQTLVLAPGADTLEERNAVMAKLVAGLVESGVISGKSVRNELQDVRSIGRLVLSEPPLVQLERAAMIYFGVPSYGVHVNGYVRDKGEVYVWVARRSTSKATYPGLWDQMVAGGQPTGLSFSENVRKECEEEASIPRDLVNRLKPAGQVSYRYATRKGLSTKILSVFDLEVPKDFVPFNGDGEVDEFLYMPLSEALDSVRKRLQVWKPNCALVLIDFAVRQGVVDPDSEDYLELNHLLRAGFTAYQNGQGV